VEPGSAPRSSLDHSRSAVPVKLQRRRPDRACDENPLAAMGR
jgi:hypothetical protein